MVRNLQVKKKALIVPAGRAPRKGRAGPMGLPKMFKSDLHEAGLDTFRFFESMINPEDVPPMRIPDDHSAMSAVIKTPFVVDLPFCGVWNAATSSTFTDDVLADPPTDGYSEVILCPGTTDCYFYTAGAQSIIWTLAQAELAEAHDYLMQPILATHLEIDTVIGGLKQIIHGLQSYNTPGGKQTAILPKINGLGHGVFEVSIVPFNTAADSSVDVILGFYNPGIQSATRTNAFFNVNWSNGTSEFVQQEVLDSEFTNFQMTLPALNATIVSFFVEVSDVDPAADWRFSLGLNATNKFQLVAEAKSACNFMVVHAPELEDLSQTRSERTTALSGLLTYMGSTLQDGGQIAAARLGMSLSPLRAPMGDVYTYLASLPFYNDDYPLRDGIYSWWLPDSVQEHFYVPYRAPRSDDLAETSVLQYALLRDNPNQAVRLKVIQNFEILTRSRLYASRTGPNNPAYSTTVGVAKIVPAVTVNFRHVGILSRALGAAKSWISKPANWVKLLKTGSSIIEKFIPGSQVASF
jgi:hypothetical protein